MGDDKGVARIFFTASRVGIVHGMDGLASNDCMRSAFFSLPSSWATENLSYV